MAGREKEEHGLDTAGQSAGSQQSRLMTVLLVLTVTVPALAVSWGFEDGRLAFVRYREPKLIAAALLGWVLISAFAWRYRHRLGLPDLRRALWHPAVPMLAAFLGYLMITGLWVRVPQNFGYELNQYLLLYCLLLVLLVWNDLEPSVAGIVHGGIVASLALVTVVGLVQWAVPTPFLSPINPEIAASHPSLMGYKNPAALAVLGQLFLLVQLMVTARRWPWRAVLGAVLTAELIYLFSLGSRTSYLALGGTIVLLTGLWLMRRPSLSRALRGVAVGLAVMLLLIAGLAIHAPIRQRAASMVSYLADPASFLESDRGTYLRNTLHMVRHRPLGVGLGDWQTHYPVYRFHEPEHAIPLDVQVRRAHSDHVQILGEAGWPGLALWGVFLATLVWKAAREFLRSGRWQPFFLTGQLVAFIIAMATDYVIELPYHKLQLFLVVFLSLASGRAGPTAASSGRSRVLLVVAAAASLLTIGQGVLHVELARKLHLAAHMELSYARSLRAQTGPADQPSSLHLARSYLQGTRFASRAGHSKTFHKHWIILAHSAERLGQRDVALAATREALDLHPHYPPAYLLMSQLMADDARVAQRWYRAYEHLMAGPDDGSVEPPALDLRQAVP